MTSGKQNPIIDQRKKLRRKDLARRTVKAGDVLLTLIPFVLVWFLYYVRIVPGNNPRMSFIFILLYTVLYIFFGKTYDAFLMSYKRISELFTGQVLAILFADTTLFLVLIAMTDGFPNVLPALCAIVAQWMLALVWCICAHIWYFKHHSAKKTAVVYDVRPYEGLVEQYGLSKKFDVQKILTTEEAIKDLTILKDMETVFFSGVHSHDRNVMLKYCIDNGITALIIPRIGDVIMGGAKKMHLFHLPILQVERSRPRFSFIAVKRVFDIVFSVTLLLAMSPIMLLVAIAVKTDGGPVFYRQVRLTRDGKEFNILKFRSMCVDAEKMTGAVLSAGENDPRITKVGRIIRACRIDELPQLFNIVKGDMSVVGPRPERPEISAEYEKEMPEFRLRLQVKAGLTGYAQVYGKYNTEPYDKLNMDLMYIAEASIVEDLKIILATFVILFSRESTDGIAEGESNAMKIHPGAHAAVPDDGEDSDE